MPTKAARSNLLTLFSADVAALTVAHQVDIVEVEMLGVELDVRQVSPEIFCTSGTQIDNFSP